MNTDHYKDSFFYTMPLLEELVEAIMGGYVIKGDGDGRSNADPAEGGNVMAMVADVKKALFLELEPQWRGVILLHHSGYIHDQKMYEDAMLELLYKLGGPPIQA